LGGQRSAERGVRRRKHGANGVTNRFENSAAMFRYDSPEKQIMASQRTLHRLLVVFPTGG
jgi:hypothetical protein